MDSCDSQGRTKTKIGYCDNKSQDNTIGLSEVCLD